MGFASRPVVLVCLVSAVVHATGYIQALVDPDHLSLLQTRVVHFRDAVRDADLDEAQVPEPRSALSRQSDEDIVDVSAEHPRRAFREAEGILKAGQHQGAHWQHVSAHRRSLHATRASQAEDSWEAEVLKAAEDVKIDDEAERFKLAARAGGASAEESERAQVDALFKEQVRAMTEAKETAVRHWATAAEQEGQAAVRSRSTVRSSEGIAEDPMQQETELRRKLIVDDMVTSRMNKGANRHKESALHSVPHAAPHRFHEHGADTEADGLDTNLQVVVDSLDRYLRPRRSKKANYNVLVGQHCGDCGTDLKIGTGGEVFDNVTTAFAAEVCGKVCDASQDCDGFSFSESLGRCYYRTSTLCDGPVDEDRDCYTKADRFENSGNDSNVHDTEDEHRARVVSDAKASIISQTKMLEDTLSEVLLKPRYTTERGHHCGDCGPENDLALVAGMVTNDSVAEVCGQMCDSYAECRGFSFANPVGRCYFLRATSCNGTADANRDCYTKVRHHSEGASSKHDGEAQTTQHLASVPPDTLRHTNVSMNVNANNTRKPQPKIGNVTMIPSQNASTENNGRKPQAKSGNVTMIRAQNASTDSGVTIMSEHESANGSATVNEEIETTTAGSKLISNSTPVTREESLGISAKEDKNISEEAGIPKHAAMMANNSQAVNSVKLAPGAYHIVNAQQQSYIDATRVGGVSLSKTNASTGDRLDGLLWRLDAVPGSQDLFFVASAHQEQFLYSNGSAVSLWKPVHARDAAKGGPASLKWRLQALQDSDRSFFLINIASGGRLGASGNEFVFSTGNGFGDAGAHPECMEWQLQRAKMRETKECDDYIAAGDPGCSWTGNWSCPGQPLGSRGVAGANGGHDSIGFRCCCHFGLWSISPELQSAA